MKKIFFLCIILSIPFLLFSQRSTVIISEVLYDTPLNEANGSENAHDGEFVSLYNYGGSHVDISRWKMEATSVNSKTGISYSCTFPLNTILFPQGIVVIAFRAEGSSFYADSFYNSFSDNNKNMGFHQNTMILPNTTTHLKIYDSNNILQDEMIYDGEDPTPQGEILLRARNGLTPTRAGSLSVSLQRKNITINDSLHVFNRSDYSGGTKNYVRLFNHDTTLTVTNGSGIKKILSHADLPASQTALNPTYDIFPPSPDVASLGKYGDYPVSLATGLVDITIPLFEIGTKRIKLPVSLSYHASGIKVDEVASSVGLGWSLNAGGCVAVTVKDKADQEGTFSYSTTNDINNSSDKTFTLYSIITNEKFGDKESDIYSYNFNGYSGQFCYNNNGEIVQLTKNGLNIKKAPGGYFGLGTYIITTLDGIEYTFGEQERFDITFVNRSIPLSNGASYYLNKIKDLMTGEEIILKYDTLRENSIYYPYFDGWETKADDNNAVASGALNGTQNPMFNTYTYLQIPSRTLSTKITTYPVFALSEIIFSGGRVKIVNHTNCNVRVFRVSEINLYNNKDSNNAIKTVKFYHDYFEDGERLRLDSLEINKSQKYSFKYNRTSLPAYFKKDKFGTQNCFGQDEWGYYNGKQNRTLFKTIPEHAIVVGDLNNTGGGEGGGGGSNGGVNVGRDATLMRWGHLLSHEDLIADPEGEGMTEQDPPDRDIPYKSSSSPKSKYAADRSSNEEAMRACSLEEIIYPTGGKTRFELEANRSIDNNDTIIVGGLRIKAIKNYANKNDNTPIRTISYEYSAGTLPPLYWDYTGNWNYTQQFDYCYECWRGLKDRACDLTFYGTSPMVPNRYHNGNVVYYNTVTEIIKDGTEIEQERNIYKYDIDEYESTYGAYTVSSTGVVGADYQLEYGLYLYARDYNSGHLLEQEHQIYKADANCFIPQKKIINKYDVFGKQYDTIGMVARAGIVYVNNSGPAGGFEYPNFYNYFDIMSQSGIKKLIKTITIDYLSDGSIQADTAEYNYDNTYYNLLSKETRKSSDGKTMVTETTYPPNYTDFNISSCPSVYIQMTQKNMLNFPVERITKTDNKIVAGQINTYSVGYGVADYNYGLLTYPRRKYILNINNPINTSGYIALTISNGPSTTEHNLDSRYTEEENYTYYSNGNIREIKNLRTGTIATILWSYNNQYPIAVIENASYDVVISALGSSTLSSITGNNNPTEEEIFALREEIQTTLGNLHPVTTNSYKPLVGITSSTNPQGITTYYKYDGSARLSGIYIIENGERKYLQEYKYNYAH